MTGRSGVSSSRIRRFGGKHWDSIPKRDWIGGLLGAEVAIPSKIPLERSRETVVWLAGSGCILVSEETAETSLGGTGT
jgi:hypothetical protein